MHVAYPHLCEANTVLRALDAIVILPTTEAIPHRLDGSVNGGSGPVGVAVVGHHTAKVLKFFVIILDGSLQPVLAVQIQDNPALVKTVMTFGEIRFDNEREKLLVGFHLQHRRVVISEMIVGSLPQVGVRVGRYGDPAVLDLIILRRSGPFQTIHIKKHSLLPPQAGYRHMSCGFDYL